MAWVLSRIRSIMVIATILILSGCEQGYSGNVGGASAGLDGEGSFVINEEGRRQYNEQCASCHGVSGQGGSGGPVVGCAQCNSLSLLTEYIERTMPTGGNEGNCVGQCASDTAEYILGAFHGFNFGEVRSELDGVTNLDASATLRKATLQLTGRLPTSEEQAVIDAQGEEGLAEALDLVLEDEMFYERLMEFYNDLLLTDKYLNQNTGSNGAMGLLDSDDFPNRMWFDNLAEGDPSNCMHEITNDSVAREPLQLVKYLAKNNLPITGVVNADYIMVNWYSQQVYDAELVDSAATFTAASEEVKQDMRDKYGCELDRVEFDPNDFKPARITRAMEFETGIPHAGILTSPMFLNRFPTTDTNRNRARASVTFDFFLDTNILAIEGARPEDAVDIESENPTLENEACYSCHHIMDPVASAYQHWDDRGRYIQSTKSQSDWDDSGIQAAGLGGTTIPISGSNSRFSSMLAWLGDAIAGDARYRRAVMRTLYRGIVGTETLKESSSAKDAQTQILDAIAEEMVTNNWNVKTAVKGIVTSAYFRAASVEASSTLADDNTGSVRLMSPEQLQRKVKSVVGREWDDLYSGDNRLLFGGMDSDDVTSRMSDPNGIMVAMQQKMSVELACQSVAEDFVRVRSPEQNDRLLFPYVTTDVTPEDSDGFTLDSNVDAIKKNIQYLHWRFLGEEVTAEGEEASKTYELFYNVWRSGNDILAEDAKDNTLYSPRPSAYLDWRCDATVHPDTGENLDSDDQIRIDDNYVIRAWTAVVTYLMSDYRFIFE